MKYFGTKLAARMLGDRSLALAYLSISIPVLLALCFLTGPFQVPDEASHFLRADELSHGRVMPIVAPGGRAAGGSVDAAVNSMTERLGNLSLDFDTNHRFVLGDFDPFWRQNTDEKPVFSQFSNTVIYFPIAHLVPGIAIAFARFFGAPPVVWFYVGRITNAVTAIAISTVAIGLLGEGALFAFTICLLPMVLFQQASLSADCLVIAFSVLLGSVVLRMFKAEPLQNWHYIFLFVSLLYVCIAKFAYIPLALLPPAVALFQRRSSRERITIIFITLSIYVIWVLWTVSIHDKVFTVGPHDGVVNVNQQLSYVFAHPFSFVIIFFKAILHNGSRLLGQMAGRQLGWLDVALPRPIVFLALASLAVAYLFRGGVMEVSTALISSTVFLLASSVFLSYFLLYLQFTPVGKSTIDGYQGRYLIPLLPLLALILPSLHLRAAWKAKLTYVVILVCAINGVSTVYTSWLNYWHPVS